MESTDSPRKLPKVTYLERERKKPELEEFGPEKMGGSARKGSYQTFFLCRFDFKRLRRLCLDIFSLRFFFRLPIKFEVP